MAGKDGHRAFGWIRRLPSKRYQASYVGPDSARHYAATTFSARSDAEGWLASESRLVESGEWTSPAERSRVRDEQVALEEARSVTVASFAKTWVRERPLKPRTRALYEDLLDKLILPSLGALTVAHLNPSTIRTWYDGLSADKPRQRAHAYALLRSICGTAVHDELLRINPCMIRGAGQAPKRKSTTEPATPEQVATIASAMPARFKLMILLAAWCALRYGELAALERDDIDLVAGVVRVRRGVTWIGGTAIVGQPKSEAGLRRVTIPPHVIPFVVEHLEAMASQDPKALLFPAARGANKHMPAARIFKPFKIAREAASRPDLRFHDLRHTGAVYAVLAGASLKEVMARLGHSSTVAAMRYQHAAESRDLQIARKLSELADSNV